MAEMSPLRRRMVEDMTIRNLSPATQQSYTHAVSKFSRYFGHSPDRLGLEDVRAYQVHLISKGISWASLNQIVCALRFFYGVTLGYEAIPERIAYARQPRKLPAVLSAGEVVRFLEAVSSLKARVALTTAYAAGLRVSEVVGLKAPDIDSDRMVIRVECGKGGKERYVMLSEQLLGILRSYWRLAHPERFLFPGRDKHRPIEPTVLHAACRSARVAAGVRTGRRVPPSRRGLRTGQRRTSRARGAARDRRDHGLPHGGARRSRRAMRRLRRCSCLLQLVPKPSLRQMSERGARGVARGASGRTAAGSLLPRRLHPAASGGRDRLSEQADGLWPAHARRRRGAHDARRRAPGRQDRPDRGAAHVGPDADPSSPCPLSRPRRRRRPRRPALDPLQAELPLVRPRAVEDLPPVVPRRPGGGIRARRTRLLRRSRSARRPRRLRRARARASQ